MEKHICELGVIGLGVMGRNLALNMADHGISVAGHDQDFEKVRLLGAAPTTHIAHGAESLPEFVSVLRRRGP